MTQREQIREYAIGAGHAVGGLTLERERDVREVSIPYPRGEPNPFLCGLTDVVSLDERGVLGRPTLEELRPSLLDPALEVA